MTTTSTPPAATRPRRFRYDSVLSASDRVRWTVDDLLGEDEPLAFDRPFLPEALARVEDLAFLDEAMRRTLNQIRGHEYLVMFGLVEEFILPFVIDHAAVEADDDDPARRQALLNFATEEAKHIRLFRRFEAAFRRDFGVSCETIGPAAAISEHVLGHDRLGVSLLVLHIEWMTQRHYLDSVRDDTAIDPLFTGLLKHHWMEEAQHAKLDTLVVEEIAARMSPAEIDAGIDAYLELVEFFDRGLEAQSRMNLDALMRAEQWTPTGAQADEILRGQHQAMRWTYLGSGITHPEFLETVRRIAPHRVAGLDEVGRVHL